MNYLTISILNGTGVFPFQLFFWDFKKQELLLRIWYFFCTPLPIYRKLSPSCVNRCRVPFQPHAILLPRHDFLLSLPALFKNYTSLPNPKEILAYRKFRVQLHQTQSYVEAKMEGWMLNITLALNSLSPLYSNYPHHL